MRIPKNLIMCPQCTELRASSYFTRQRFIDGQYIKIDEPFRTCKFCRMIGVEKARGELTTWLPSAIEADKPQYWPVGNFKIYQQFMERINA